MVRTTTPILFLDKEKSKSFTVRTEDNRTGRCSGRGDKIGGKLASNPTNSYFWCCIWVSACIQKQPDKRYKFKIQVQNIMNLFVQGSHTGKACWIHNLMRLCLGSDCWTGAGLCFDQQMKIKYQSASDVLWFVTSLVSQKLPWLVWWEESARISLNFHKTLVFWGESYWFSELVQRRLKPCVFAAHVRICNL